MSTESTKTLQYLARPRRMDGSLSRLQQIHGSCFPTNSSSDRVGLSEKRRPAGVIPFATNIAFCVLSPNPSIHSCSGSLPQTGVA